MNWYPVPDELSEKNKGDGKYTTYLNLQNKIGNKLNKCNPALYTELNDIVNIKKNRSTREVEHRRILPKNTLFYNALNNEPATRTNWHKQALNNLADADIIFLDPDNGIEVPSVSERSKLYSKYVSAKELKEYLLKGKSLIVYNHRSHEKEPIYNERLAGFRTELKDQTFKRERARRGTARDFLFFIQPKHKREICARLDEFQTSNWTNDNHFKLMD